MTLAREMRDGGWRQPGGRQLSSAQVGIVGCGHIGQQVARLCAAFGARLLAHDIRVYDAFYRELGVTPVSLETLLTQSDFVTIHLPLDASTRGLIGAREIGWMKRSAFLINTARGGIVDEPALKAALVEGASPEQRSMSLRSSRRWIGSCSCCRISSALPTLAEVPRKPSWQWAARQLQDWMIRPVK